MRLIQLVLLFSDTTKGYEIPDKRIFINPIHIMRVLPFYNVKGGAGSTVVLENGDRYDVVETCDQINKLIDREIERTSMYYNAMG